ncbi:Fic family protein [Bacillus sp. XF8]|uniref:Fic family protein n=1 Tax=Bacillus sp. XF8 TaxID=2819289 RepID=UPI001AA069F6|nr:Fic family protein [Bacillus sp. XF8]MBO1578158.1 Fic family protein [Bacillus sp. XF8]
MRNFFEEKYVSLENKKELLNLVSEISEYKGKLEVYQHLRPELFNLLEKNIPLQYMKNSTIMYENITFSNKQLQNLILNDMAPQTIEEDALVCYYTTLELIQKKYHTLPIKPETIQELHFQLLNYSTSESGNWRKTKPILPNIPEFNIHPNQYKAISYEAIPQALHQLCEQYNTLRSNGDFHSLLLIPRFILNFLCIYPFNKGNGRLAQILIQLLLIKSGYTFVKYICIDKYIKKHQLDYYTALYKSAANWYYGEHCIGFWLKVFLTIVLAAYQELHTLVRSHIITHTKSKRIKKYIDEQKHSFTKENIRNAYPDIGESTINRTLHSLQLQGYIKLISKGRNAQWIKLKS